MKNETNKWNNPIMSKYSIMRNQMISYSSLGFSYCWLFCLASWFICYYFHSHLSPHLLSRALIQEGSGRVRLYHGQALHPDGHISFNLSLGSICWALWELRFLAIHSLGPVGKFFQGTSLSLMFRCLGNSPKGTLKYTVVQQSTLTGAAVLLCAKTLGLGSAYCRQQTS